MNNLIAFPGTKPVVVPAPPKAEPAPEQMGYQEGQGDIVPLAFRWGVTPEGDFLLILDQADAETAELAQENGIDAFLVKNSDVLLRGIAALVARLEGPGPEFA